MTGFEPGVQLTADTIAAMERLSTSPSKPAMTKQHKATPEQWDDAGAFASDTRACLLELRARVELLEATQQRPPHQDKLDRLIALGADDGEPIVMPGYPAGSLVDRVGNQIKWGIDAELDEEGIARAAILEVAAWLTENYASDVVGPPPHQMLRDEANR